jgi:hypothetical protein
MHMHTLKISCEVSFDGPGPVFSFRPDDEGGGWGTHGLKAEIGGDEDAAEREVAHAGVAAVWPQQDGLPHSPADGVNRADPWPV